MVYRKNYRGKGRRRKSAWGRYAKATAPAVGYVALKAAQMVARKYLNVEFKDHLDEATLAGANITSVGVVEDLCVITQGDGEHQRNGEQIKAKSLTLHGHLEFNEGGGRQSQIVRMIVVSDNDFRGPNVPNISNILNGYLTSVDVDSFRELNQVSRFKVLQDKKYILTENRPTVILNKTFALNHKIRYTGTTGVEASGGEGTIWLMFFSNQTVSDYPELYLSWRLRYVDN